MMAARVLGFLLLLQAAAFYALASREEVLPAVRPLPGAGEMEANDYRPATYAAPA